MATLTYEQLKFLRDQKIPLSLMFDASGMRKVDYEVAMKAEEKLFAFGVTACSKGGHTLRTRAGHCMQCNTANIAYILRHYKDAHVYVAGSLKASLIKVGSSVDCDLRIKELNRIHYAGVSDWTALSTVRSEKSGMVEFFVHDRLSDKQAKIPYTKDGRTQLGSESFSCDYNDAKSALMELCRNDSKLKFEEHPVAGHYNFSQKLK